jgi:hypothetical protein
MPENTFSPNDLKFSDKLRIVREEFDSYAKNYSKAKDTKGMVLCETIINRMNGLIDEHDAMMVLKGFSQEMFDERDSVRKFNNTQN